LRNVNPQIAANAATATPINDAFVLLTHREKGWSCLFVLAPNQQREQPQPGEAWATIRATPESAPFKIQRQQTV